MANVGWNMGEVLSAVSMHNYFQIKLFILHSFYLKLKVSGCCYWSQSQTLQNTSCSSSFWVRGNHQDSSMYTRCPGRWFLFKISKNEPTCRRNLCQSFVCLISTLNHPEPWITPFPCRGQQSPPPRPLALLPIWNSYWWYWAELPYIHKRFFSINSEFCHRQLCYTGNQDLIHCLVHYPPTNVYHYCINYAKSLFARI